MSVWLSVLVRALAIALVFLNAIPKCLRVRLKLHAKLIRIREATVRFHPMFGNI